MNYLRQTLNAFIVVATSVILALLAYESLEAVNLDNIINLAIIVMDVAVVLATFVNLFYYRDNAANFVLTLLPGIAFTVALFAKYFNWQIPSFALLIYDLYLLYWYGYLVFAEQGQLTVSIEDVAPATDSSVEEEVTYPQETVEVVNTDEADTNLVPDENVNSDESII